MGLLKVETSLAHRVERNINRILDKDRYQPMVGILMLGKRETAEDVATACTDGLNEWYGETFCNQLNDPELRFIILHENYHKLQQHPTLLKPLFDLDPKIAGIACDHWINLRLIEENKADGFAVMPTDENGNPLGVADPKYTGWDSTAIFWDMYNEKKGKQGNDQGNGQPQPSAGQQEEQDGSGSGVPQLDDHSRFDEANKLTPEEQHDITNAVEEALRQGILMASKTGNSNADLEKFRDLLRPKVDWRKELREFLKSHCRGNQMSTYRRPNRRYMGLNPRVYLPSTYSQKVESVVFGNDTSGSMMGQRHKRTMSEIASALKLVHPEEVHLIYWDGAVENHETYKGGRSEADSVMDSTLPRGGGSTNPDVVPEYMTEHRIKPQCLVMLTDGEFFDEPNWSLYRWPTLWLCVDNKNFTPKAGRVVHIDKHDL